MSFPVCDLFSVRGEDRASKFDQVTEYHFRYELFSRYFSTYNYHCIMYDYNDKETSFCEICIMFPE